MDRKTNGGKSQMEGHRNKLVKLCFGEVHIHRGMGKENHHYPLEHSLSDHMKSTWAIKSLTQFIMP